ncbi:MAG: hypothetical protein JW966_01900 [Anaerolineae bacterium]|nr:hypothetical protein [Anaerolineae bacterium]
MTITKIMQQAQALSPQERKELVKLLIDSLDGESLMPDELEEYLTRAFSPQARKILTLLWLDSLNGENSMPDEPAEHWGQALNRLLDSLDMSDWEGLDVDDPVEWVKHQRTAEQQHRLGDWGSAE